MALHRKTLCRQRQGSCTFNHLCERCFEGSHLTEAQLSVTPPMARSALKRKKAKLPPAKKQSRGLAKRGIKAERASRAVDGSVLQSAKQRLDPQSLWDANASFSPNLPAPGLQRDANHRGDRSSDGGTPALQPVDASESDEMRAAVGKPRSTGTRMPKRLTANETRLCEALMERHGDDVVSMSRDMELNPHQVRSHLLLVCGTHTLLTVRITMTM
jgi:hypothetical protein